MAMTVGGTLGITFPDGNTVSPANVFKIYPNFVSDISNILIIKNGVHFAGSTGLILKNGESNSYTTYTSGNVINLVISANTNNYNLRTAAIAAGWNGTSAVNIFVTINIGILVGSTSTGSYAFDTGSTFPTGSNLILSNYGSILGAGGAGGGSDTAGGAGGPAIRAQTRLTIVNIGIIGGGGGGGGGGASYVVDKTTYPGDTGGGGQGQSGGSGANSGSYTAPGAAGGSDAGAGGTLGQAGGAGGLDAPSGGAGGAAIIGSSNVLMYNVGNIYGGQS